ncbi:MAG: DUF4377 domain-containing protein [Alistipes sp.]|nr:DUF4377 domain-containing protein [Alistipes sp.]
MKRLIQLTAILLCAAVCIACDNESGDETPQIARYTIASHRIYTPNVVSTLPVLCYLVKPEGTTKWQCFYNPISGFTYEPGTEYEVEVEIIPISNPPMDASNCEYRLRRILRQETTTSDNLPDGAVSE